MVNEEPIKDFIYMMLESEDLETFLERFDLTPDEVFLKMCQEGLVDLELLKDMMGYEG